MSTLKGIERLNISRMASLTAENCSSDNLPSLRIRACWSTPGKSLNIYCGALGKPTGFANVHFSRNPRNWEVRGTTTTKARASSGWG